ncbi:Polymer-forming cytoskeletal [compost metagenome]|uniref:Polymer-forming cytoskeletal protein n=1 Tax=Polaromonas aquatica TaxID=332657 RepID=A0ABW1TUS2_9BURK
MTLATTTGPEAQSGSTLSPPLSRIPEILKADATAPGSALNNPTSLLPVAPDSQTQRPPADHLRFVQRPAEIRPAAIQPATEQLREVRTCVLPKGLTFIGEAHYPCDVRIDGVVDGKVTAEPDRTITVEKDGKFKGSLKATNVRIEGEVDGEVSATGGLASFGPKSVCKGHITYGRLTIAEGADVEASMKKLAA